MTLKKIYPLQGLCDSFLKSQNIVAGTSYCGLAVVDGRRDDHGARLVYAAGFGGCGGGEVEQPVEGGGLQHGVEVVVERLKKIIIKIRFHHGAIVSRLRSVVGEFPHA